MVATLIFVMLTIVEGLQGRQELAKTTLKNLKQLKKVTLKGQVKRETLLMISIPMRSMQIENQEMIQRSWYQRVLSI